jgi:hypothetical protein
VTRRRRPVPDPPPSTPPAEFADRWGPIVAAAPPTSDPAEVERRTEALWHHLLETGAVT